MLTGIRQRSCGLASRGLAGDTTGVRPVRSDGGGPTTFLSPLGHAWYKCPGFMRRWHKIHKQNKITMAIIGRCFFSECKLYFKSFKSIELGMILSSQRGAKRNCNARRLDKD